MKKGFLLVRIVVILPNLAEDCKLKVAEDLGFLEGVPLKAHGRQAKHLDKRKSKKIPNHKFQIPNKFQKPN